MRVLLRAVCDQGAADIQIHGGARSPGTPKSCCAWVFCVSWRAEFGFRVAAGMTIDATDADGTAKEIVFSTLSIHGDDRQSDNAPHSPLLMMVTMTR